MNILTKVPATSLEIELKGTEKVSFRASRNGKQTGRESAVEDKSKAEKVLVKYRTPIHVFSERILSKGQFTFPFTMKLGASLPASLLYSGISKSYA